MARIFDIEQQDDQITNQEGSDDNDVDYACQEHCVNRYVKPNIEFMTKCLKIQLLHLNKLYDNRKIGLRNFEVSKILGEGGYGKVFQVRKITGKDKGSIFAMKVLRNATVVRLVKTRVSTEAERNILKAMKHPFIINLIYSFGNIGKVYLVFEYLCGGELITYLKREGSFSEDATCFYLSEIILALQHLHNQGIIFSDLKPENILLDGEGHIKLTDFGIVKEHIDDIATDTFFVKALDILQQSNHGKTADWWTLGALMFAMLTGEPPFTGSNRRETIEKIIEGNLNIPQNLSNEASDLIRKLLKIQVEETLEYRSDDGDQIKKHSFFRHINWQDVILRKLIPPFKPLLNFSHT